MTSHSTATQAPGHAQEAPGHAQRAPWQILDVGSIWMREFASAMAELYPVTAWWPEMRRLGGLESWQRPESLPNPRLEVLRFPLQRGYARTPVRQLLPFQHSLQRRLARHLAAAGHNTTAPLIVTTPFYAPLAERWPGPVVYYSTDLTARYEGLSHRQVLDLDRRLCAVSTAVCPNSRRIGDYFIHDALCDPRKITVIPNATRQANISPEPLLTPQPLADSIAHLPRPIAGVIGNLATNMDWLILEGAVERTPWLTWVLVGPTPPISEAPQAAARARLQQNPRVVFTGAKPYGELQDFARSFDVAILPYRKREPTFSGSSTRFYEHLSACRPMVGTRGFAELLEKPPLIELADTPDEMAAALEHLRALRFTDGHELARWQSSRLGTWTERARSLVHALEARRA